MILGFVNVMILAFAIFGALTLCAIVAGRFMAFNDSEPQGVATETPMFDRMAAKANRDEAGVES